MENYDHIPTLKELFPRIEGSQAGFVYAIVPSALKGRTQEGGFSGLQGGEVFRITGLKGSIECEAMGAGEPIRGISMAQYSHELFVDVEIEKVTGHVINEVEANAAQEGQEQGSDQSERPRAGQKRKATEASSGDSVG